ncbi:hypothetical protein Pla175_08480 [Pirellulimonas nuda]|uniref:DUF1573 domain-containing protein n=1 Tax=Pirellulimonas nuda TaxID=2528009 RepID=A0A518D7Q4_9BACT|nr:DUF1573 domain-containing protein [Pirellulimonas nuda]QDU87486.1 hypothetical protein Pla175_08480 [Pirellulimonas nuda]
MRLPLTFLIAILLGASVGGAWGYLRIGPSASVEQMIDTAQAPVPGEAPAAAVPAPRAYVDLQHYEFGVMQNGTTQSREFHFENRGNAPLELIAGQPTCKCTIGEVPSEPIPPGGSADVLVSWTPRALGDFRQTAPIITNDLRAPRIELTIHGEVIETAGLEPQQFDFGRIRAGEPATASALITSNDRDAFELSVETPTDADGKPLLTAETTPLTADELPEGAKSGYRITLGADGQLPLGYFSETVTLKTDLEDLPEVSPYALAHVEGDFSIRGPLFNQEASLLSLGVVSGSVGTATKMLIVLRGEHADALTLEVAEVDPAEIEVSLGEIEHPKPGLAHVRMEVRVPPGSPPVIRFGNDQTEYGEVRLKTNHPDSPVVNFRVRVAVQ